MSRHNTNEGLPRRPAGSRGGGGGVKRLRPADWSLEAGCLPACLSACLPRSPREGAGFAGWGGGRASKAAGAGDFASARPPRALAAAAAAAAAMERSCVVQCAPPPPRLFA